MIYAYLHFPKFFILSEIFKIEDFWECSVTLKRSINSFMKEVPIIQKPVYCFAEKINVLVSMWKGPSG